MAGEVHNWKLVARTGIGVGWQRTTTQSATIYSLNRCSTVSESENSEQNGEDQSITNHFFSSLRNQTFQLTWNFGQIPQKHSSRTFVFAGTEKQVSADSWSLWLFPDLRRFWRMSWKPCYNKGYSKCGFNVIVATFEILTYICVGFEMRNNLVPH